LEFAELTLAAFLFAVALAVLFAPLPPAFVLPVPEQDAANEEAATVMTAIAIIFFISMLLSNLFALNKVQQPCRNKIQRFPADSRVFLGEITDGSAENHIAKKTELIARPD
jgi:hypothetical protein